MSSSHPSNARHPLRLANGAYASHGNDDRVHMDVTSPPLRPLPPTLNERVDVDPWWWALQDRILTLSPPLMSFPRSGMQLLVLRNSSNLRRRPMEQNPYGNSILTAYEQKQAVEKLKKEIYNPTPKKIMRRLGQFYRQNQNMVKQVDDEDDDKKCAVCLEDFEPKEKVTLTPCNHMFHEDCILPWVKAHGKCPVCRFLLYDRTESSGVSSTNNGNLVDDPLTSNLVSFVTPRGTSAANAPFWF